ncbi:DUF4132 domain-containing protein [Umezawaea endophytica]|uniref:DUF4132 domain-containing protein n=1 Tax=Umezawaea endophytica TaxID=1654476 RepID=A0A9X2VJM0_9PSEU|nr:DUF4132 domain-containing protein [Umezawaea endophytica]MCS7477717.1 DUF4132 domain-containing protein [Umezawaea endophytica]
MRRLEYIGGSSEKFWEASCEDAAVTVRWGRLGTAGQTKRKEFASAAAARSFLDAQAAAKLRKGYSEVGEAAAVKSPAAPAAEGPPEDEGPAALAAEGPPEVEGPATPAVDGPPEHEGPVVDGGRSEGGTTAVSSSEAESPAAAVSSSEGVSPAVDPADEDVFTPGTQVRSAYPRRDQGRVKRKADPAAVGTTAALVERHSPRFTPLIDGGDQEMREAVARYLAGAADPLGAAAAVVALAAVLDYRERRGLGLVASDWVQQHGVAFAAAATVLAADVVAEAKSKVLRRAQPRDFLRWGSAVEEMRGEVRRALAAAADDEYAAAVAEVVALDIGHIGTCVAAFLLPTETALVDRAVAEAENAVDAVTRACLLAALSTPEQLAAVSEGSVRRVAERDGRVVPTLLRALGPSAAAAFADWLEDADADLTRRLLAGLVEMPTDDAFTRLLVRVEAPQVRPALQEAMRRYPRRAARLLAAAAVADQPWSPAAADLLRSHLVAVPALLDGLAPAEREVASTLLAGVERLPDASAESLPEVLRVPPWTRPKPAPPVVVPGLPIPVAARIAWLPDEERAAAAERDANLLYHRRTTDWAAEVARRGIVAYPTFLHAPLELVEPLIAAYRPTSTWRVESWGAALLERFGLAALPALLNLGTAADALRVLRPVLDERVARTMVAALDKKSVRSQAVAWLTRHGADALPFLLPTALGALGRERTAAEGAVRLVAAEIGEAAVVAAASALGAEAVRAVSVVLATDPLSLLPKKLPVPGGWVAVATLPQIRLRDERVALPTGAVGDLLTMLALSRPGEPYGGVAPVVEACDPASVAEFGWALFEQWRAAGMPSKDGWALTALGVLGDDGTVRALAPVIRAWPGEGGHVRAVTGLDVLADIGTDVALMHLDGIARKVKFAGLREKAREKIEHVAAKLGLSPERLADRLVPDLGLSRAGSAVLDYGPRRFVVGFDERLRPFVSDEDGTPRKSLPKPGAKDDEGLATAAYQRFTDLKKDVRTLAADQITRLERAMVSGRTWTGEEFTEFLAGHPLLVHLVRRLVWVTQSESGAVTGSFRVAEDSSLSTVDDDVFVLPEDAVVAVAHPLRLGESVEAWSGVFADYEILQPFPQLGRPVHALTEAERAGTRLSRFEGVVLPTTRVLLLVRLGWERGAPMDGGVEPGLYKRLPGGQHAIVELDPGLVVGDLDALGDQTLRRVFVDRDTVGHRWHNTPADTTLGALDAVSASELLADLAELTEVAGS